MSKPESSAPSALDVVRGALEEDKGTLRNFVGIMRAYGNWNYDPYMHGMTNGLILALAVLEGTTPEYLEAPDAWLADEERE